MAPGSRSSVRTALERGRRSPHPVVRRIDRLPCRQRRTTPTSSGVSGKRTVIVAARTTHSCEANKERT